MSMLSYGKAIYRKESAKRKFFVYTHLKAMVGKHSKTGICFSLKQDIYGVAGYQCCHRDAAG